VMELLNNCVACCNSIYDNEMNDECTLSRE
jgi:hypothetical protein